MSDITDLLDELDAARKKATPAPWEQDPSWPWGIKAAGVVAASAEKPADAALIVAAVNALPRLTAALRNVQRAIETAPTLRFANDYPVNAVPVAELLGMLAAALVPAAVAGDTDTEGKGR